MRSGVTGDLGIFARRWLDTPLQVAARDQELKELGVEPPKLAEREPQKPQPQYAMVGGVRVIR